MGKTLDVSKHQGSIDWAKVKKAGFDSVLIKIGAGDLASQKDPMFEANYKGAKKEGFQIGGYWYSYSNDEPQDPDIVKDAKLEAKACLACIDNKKFDLPIFYDLEEAGIAAKGKTKCTDAAMEFCSTIKAAGYVPGVYANANWFKNYLNYQTIAQNYAIWLAQWKVNTPSFTCEIWQYADDGKIDGIKTAVDLDKILSINFVKKPAPKPDVTKKQYASLKMQACGAGYISRVGVVKNIQRILKMCDYDIDVTGKYDSKTVAAVKKYQKKFGLSQTGVCDAKTLKSIFSCE